jgi:metal-dependent hydrolase (beta-lactamase superfamily II)
LNTGAVVFKKNRNPEDFTKIYLTHVPEKHLKLTHGLTVVQDAKSKEIVLVVRFVPFTKMSPEEFAEYQEVTCTLMKMAKTGRIVKGNGPQVSGKMFAIGWRGGEFFFQKNCSKSHFICHINSKYFNGIL